MFTVVKSQIRSRRIYYDCWDISEFDDVAGAVHCCKVVGHLCEQQRAEDTAVRDPSAQPDEAAGVPSLILTDRGPSES